jgi:hypothetical protein
MRLNLNDPLSSRQAVIACSSSRPPHSFDLNGCGGLLLWQRGKSEVWLDDTEVGEQGLGLLILDAGVHNHVITGDPVDGCGNAVLIAGLKGVDDSEHLSGVAAGGSWVGQDEADRLLGVDDEDGADGEGNALGVDVGGVLVVEHVIGVCDLAVLVTDDGEGELAAGDLVDVPDPSSVRLDGVGRESDQLDAALGELGLELGEGAELGGADGSVVFGVGEEDHPIVADEFMEIDGTVGGLGLEIGGDGTQAETEWWWCDVSQLLEGEGMMCR